MRRSYKELEEAVERAKEIFEPLGAKYVASKGRFTFKNGARLKMRFIERDADARKYQGHSYSWIGMDELGNYATPYCYNQMLSCLRSPHAGVLCQIRSSGNPGGPGHGWIKRRFIDGQEPDHIYTYDITIRIPDPENPKQLINKAVQFSRCFIPSKVTDNLKLMANDPMYVARLHMLPEHVRRAYLDGDWNVFIGQVFGEIKPERHYVRHMLLPWDWPRFATLDWGHAKPFSIGFWCVSPQGRLYRISEMYGCVKGMENEGVQKDALTVAKELLPVMNAMGMRKVYADPACWQDHGHGLSIAKIFEKCGVPMIPANRDRKAALSIMHTMLQQNLDDGEPMFQVFEDSCPDWIRTVPNLVGAKHDIEDVDTNAEDHPYDETRFAIMSPEMRNASRSWINGNRELNQKGSDSERDWAI